MSVLHKLGPGNSHSAAGGVAVGVVEVSASHGVVPDAFLVRSSAWW